MVALHSSSIPSPGAWEGASACLGALPLAGKAGSGGGSRGAPGPRQGRTDAPGNRPWSQVWEEWEFLASKSPIEAAPGAQLLRIGALLRDSPLCPPWIRMLLPFGRPPRQPGPGSRRPGGATPAGRPRKTIPVTPARRMAAHPAGFPSPPQLHSQEAAIPVEPRGESV